MYKSLLAIGMAIPCLSFSQQFQQSFGGAGFDIIKDVVQLEDQSYVTFGITSGESGAKGIISQVDGLGNLISSRALELMNGTELNEIKINEAGNAFFVGAATSDQAGNSEILYGELTLEGDVLWSKGLPNIGFDVAYGLTLTANGGFALGAMSSSYSAAGDLNPIVVQVDAQGETVWSTAINMEGYARPMSLTQHPDGGIVIFGHHEGPENDGNDPMLIKMSSDGDVEWIKDFKAPGNDVGWSIIANDNGFLLGGDSNAMGAGSNDLYLIQVDLDGELISQRLYGSTGNDHLSTIYPGKGDKMMIVGTTSSFGGGQLDMLAMEIEADGSVSWSKAYGGEEKEVGFSILETPDGGYMLGGYSRTFAESFYFNAYLVKTNERGDCFCNSVWDQTLEVNPGEFVPGNVEWTQATAGESTDWDLQSVPAEMPTVNTICTFGELIDSSAEGEESSGEITLGLEEMTSQILSLVSVPHNGNLQIEVFQNTPANLSVYTITGKMVQNVSVQGIGRQTLTVKVQDLSQGVYLVNLIDADSTVTKKIYVH